MQYGGMLRLLAAGAATFGVAGGAQAAVADFGVDFPLEQSVGPLRAGQLCMPKGALRGTDLVRDDQEFALLVRQALDDLASRGASSLGDGTAPRIDVHLKAVAVKLCARSWGMFGLGDTKSLSGDAEFTFSWRLTGTVGSPNNEKIIVRPTSKGRMTGPMILRLALADVLERAARVVAAQ